MGLNEWRDKKNVCCLLWVNVNVNVYRWVELKWSVWLLADSIYVTWLNKFFSFIVSSSIHPSIHPLSFPLLLYNYYFYTTFMGCDKKEDVLWDWFSFVLYSDPHLKGRCKNEESAELKCIIQWFIVAWKSLALINIQESLCWDTNSLLLLKKGEKKKKIVRRYPHTPLKSRVFLLKTHVLINLV